MLDTDGYALGLELARAGLKNWARAELRPYKAKVAGDRAASLTLAEALIEAGDYVGAKSLAQKYCSTPSSSTADPWATRLCWPRPEVGALDPELSEHGLPAHLPYSIMTAESALKPWVTSPAGARGLMQLMPALAAGLHRDRFPGSPYDPDQLYQPAYNAMLGVTELGQLQAHFGTDKRIRDEGMPHARLPLAIAGYNGGKAAVERWLSAGAAPIEADVFMENIGYTETRRYVRRVLGYMQTYRLVYGD
jgi:soluble lytic murein transglycosylase